MFEVCRFWFPFNLLTSVDQESRFLWWRSVTLSSSNTWGRPGFILRSVWIHKRHFWPPTPHIFYYHNALNMSCKEDLWHRQYFHFRKFFSFLFWNIQHRSAAFWLSMFREGNKTSVECLLSSSSGFINCIKLWVGYLTSYVLVFDLPWSFCLISSWYTSEDTQVRYTLDPKYWDQKCFKNNKILSINHPFNKFHGDLTIYPMKWRVSPSNVVEAGNLSYAQSPCQPKKGICSNWYTYKFQLWQWKVKAEEMPDNYINKIQSNHFCF